jgi:hypothetical protein
VHSKSRIVDGSGEEHLSRKLQADEWSSPDGAAAKPKQSVLRSEDGRDLLTPYDCPVLSIYRITYRAFQQDIRQPDILVILVY